MQNAGKNQLKIIKKKNTSKTKWGYQNSQVGSCGHNNQIEGKATKKPNKKLILKRIGF